MATSSATSSSTKPAPTKISFFKHVDDPCRFDGISLLNRPTKSQNVRLGDLQNSPAPTVYITDSDSELDDIKNEPRIDEETEDIEEPLETINRSVHPSAETASRSLRGPTGFLARFLEIYVRTRDALLEIQLQKFWRMCRKYRKYGLNFSNYDA